MLIYSIFCLVPTILLSKLYFANKQEMMVILYFFNFDLKIFQGLQQQRALTFRLLLHVSRMFSILPMFSSVTNISVMTDTWWSGPLDHDLSGSVRISSFDRTDTLLDVWGASAEKERHTDAKWEKHQLEALSFFKLLINTFRQSTISRKTSGVNLLLEWFLSFASVPIPKRQSKINRATLTCKSKFR